MISAALKGTSLKVLVCWISLAATFKTFFHTIKRKKMYLCNPWTPFVKFLALPLTWTGNYCIRSFQMQSCTDIFAKEVKRLLSLPFDLCVCTLIPQYVPSVMLIHCILWFRICEICGTNALNIAGEQTNEANNASVAPLAASAAPIAFSESQGCWHGRRVMNFLLASMVFAFVISWLFHFNILP